MQQQGAAFGSQANSMAVQQHGELKFEAQIT